MEYICNMSIYECNVMVFLSPSSSVSLDRGLLRRFRFANAPQLPNLIGTSSSNVIVVK